MMMIHMKRVINEMHQNYEYYQGMARLSQPKYCLNEVEDYGIEAESGNPWQFLAIRGNPWYIPCQSVVRQVCAQFSSVWFVHLLSESRR